MASPTSSSTSGSTRRGLPCDPDVVPFNGFTYDGQPITAGGSDASFGRDFPIGAGLVGQRGARVSGTTARTTGDDITVELLRTTAPPIPARRAGRWRGATSSTTRPARRPTRPTGATRSATARSTASRAGATTSCSTTPTSPDNAATDGAGQPGDHRSGSRRRTAVLLRPVRLHLGPARLDSTGPSSPTGASSRASWCRRR